MSIGPNANAFLSRAQNKVLAPLLVTGLPFGNERLRQRSASIGGLRRLAAGISSDLEELSVLAGENSRLPGIFWYRDPRFREDDRVLECAR